MGAGAKGGIGQLVKAINTARGKAKASEPVTVLLENSAGQKNSIGGKFEDLREILDQLGSGKEYGVCLDTCHTFASGYDLRTKASVEETLEAFDNLNDSKGPVGSGLDRHEHIGLGAIGAAGMAALLNHKAIKGLPIIMETPIDEKRGDEQNLEAVRKLA
jgi:deoxyribonuclease-4